MPDASGPQHEEWREADPDGPAGTTGSCPATRAATEAAFDRIVSRLLTPEEGGDGD